MAGRGVVVTEHPFEAPLVSWEPGSAEELEATRVAAEQGRAIATLLRGELARRRDRVTSEVPAVTESPGRLVRRGAVIPTEAMIGSLVGRIRTADAVRSSTVEGGDAQRPPTITVATRFHDTADLPSLERCLASLEAQREVDLTALVVVQGTDASALRAVRDSVDGVWLGDHKPRVVGVANPNDTDVRSALLNRALDIHYTDTSNDFFYVLDHDDLVFSHALASLARPVAGTAAAVSFGRVMVARYICLYGYDYLYGMEDHFRAGQRNIAELAIDNFFPIHGYVYHTRAMPDRQLRFNESMDRLEDYEALLRVVTDFPVHTSAIDTLIGLYSWKGPRAVHGPIEGASADETARWDRNRLALAETFVEIASRPRAGS